MGNRFPQWGELGEGILKDRVSALSFFLCNERIWPNAETFDVKLYLDTVMSYRFIGLV